LRYRTEIDEITVRRQSAGFAPEFSEEWYLFWWARLYGLKESDLTVNKEIAIRLGKYACDSYLAAVLPEARQVKAGQPTCSIMLATDSTVYLLIDFPDFWSPAFSPYRDELPGTIGRAFGDSAVDGQVILRSPWDPGKNGPERIYWTYPIRALSFADEEKESGTRTGLNEMWSLMSSFMKTGQTSKDSLFEDPNHKFLLRTVGVVRYSIGPGQNVTLDTTDGAEWSVPQQIADRCAIREGTELEISTQSVNDHVVTFDGPPTITNRQVRGECWSERVGFLGAW
jgi:hypothetical protein